MYNNYKNSSGPRKSFFGSGSQGNRRSASPFKRGNFAPRFGSRPRFGGGRRSGGGNTGLRINPAKFINKVTLTEEAEVFKPEHKFSDFKIEESLKRGIEFKGYKEPTPIQDRSIPHILNGLDIVGIANTGTGKTAAFLIPLINKVLLNRREKVLIIVPTRELAIQIDEELQGFTGNMRIFSACCVGGMNIGRQISSLRREYNFVIGTPGRLKDLIDRRVLNLKEFNSLVLDEADRMLDMGFINDMRFVVSLMPKERHTLFFSATLSPDIERLIKDFLKDPVRISVKTRDTSKNVEQDVIKVERGQDKLQILHDILSQKEFNKVLIFGRTKHGVERLSKMLAAKGFKAESIHGNKNHAQRQRALNSFKDNYIQILVATDVAARGLDIPDVSHVINYELPATYEDYVHRIGRTGRANKKGKALTFVE